MYAVEFQTAIENGIVHIPKKYKEIQDTKKATIVVMYENIPYSARNEETIQSQLEEFHRLRNKSKNEIQATMELATNIDDMVDDGIF